jgi:hypothetical protein
MTYRIIIEPTAEREIRAAVQGGFRCCLVARKRRNRSGARFASRGAAEVHSLAASAPGEVKSRGNHQLC